MKILVIHNPERKDRLKTLEYEMSVQGYDYIIIPAVTGGPVQQNISRAHKKCIRYAIEHELDKVLILEDDVMFLTNSALKEFIKLSESLPQDWKWFMGGVYDGTITELNKEIGIVRQLSGLHCYMVNSSFYNTILEADERYHIDRYLSHKRWGNNEAYVAYPFKAIQYDGYSDNVGKITNYNSKLQTKYKFY